MGHSRSSDKRRARLKRRKREVNRLAAAGAADKPPVERCKPAPKT